MVCLDLEGVLTPEIWIAFAEETGIPEFRRTTRDEPDYGKLMRFRIDLLAQHGLKLPDIQQVIAGIQPMEGALDFVRAIREQTQLIILSDTFQEFAKPLMAKLEYPTLFCNSLITDRGGAITGYALRQEKGKMQAVLALKSLNMRVFAAGDSYNDLDMLREAHWRSLFRAPQAIQENNPDIPHYEAYSELLAYIEEFLRS